jgi:hemoglobin/transferrin/lactoferrin receptor protein
MRKFLMSSVLFSVFGLGAANAQEAGVEYAQADQITVTATRTAKRIDDVPSTVTVITEEDIQNNLVDDIRDLVRFEPGVTVPTSPARFNTALSGTGRDGNSGFNIRGLEGNRVLIQTDGVRVPDAFSFGPFVTGRGDYVDLGVLKSVEILRGPASALYGSDGLAGAVSFITADPGDLLLGEQYAVRARIGVASSDERVSAGLVGVADWEDWQGLLAYTQRESHELENQGEIDTLNATRTTPNPQDIEASSILGKLVFSPSDAHRFRLTYEHAEVEVASDILSARSATTQSLVANDTTERDRAALDYSYESETGFIRDAFIALSYQQGEIRQYTYEDRTPAVDRSRDNTFENSVWGMSGQFESVVTTGAAEHVFTYGGDYSRTHQEGVRGGTVPTPPEVFPLRPFPSTDYTLAGVFVQDEISFLDGRVRFYPAVRYDAYELEPEIDALYSGLTAPQSDAHVSPKLGIVTWPTENFSVFVNYARGFKAPAPSQVNNGFANPTQFYSSLPNPDLAPETSETLEGGVRFRDLTFAGGTWQASATAFTGHYDDFIEQVQISGSFTALDPTIFQYINLGSVDLSGVEGRLSAEWESGFGAIVSAAYARGDQERGGPSAPLDSVQPFRLVAGLTYDDPEGRFGGQAVTTFSDAKEADHTTCPTTCFLPEDSTIYDITAYWRVTDAATFRVAVFNLTDETYWWWNDVRGLSAASTIRDAFTQPGRNVSASLNYRF